MFTGEACGLAMGLVMLGSKSATAIEEMVGVSKAVGCQNVFYTCMSILNSYRTFILCVQVILSMCTVNQEQNVMMLLSCQYAQETQHEKILRGLSLGIALVS